MQRRCLTSGVSAGTPAHDEVYPAKGLHSSGRSQPDGEKQPEYTLEDNLLVTFEDVASYTSHVIVTSLTDCTYTLSHT